MNQRLSISCIILVTVLFASLLRADEVINLAPNPVPDERIINRDHPLLSPRSLLTKASSQVPSGLSIPNDSLPTLVSASLKFRTENYFIYAWTEGGQYHFALQHDGRIVAQAKDANPTTSARYVSLPFSDKTHSVPLYLQAGGGERAPWLRYFIAEQMAGTWKVGDRSIKVGLIDYSHEQHYGSPADVSILLDVDEDGEFDMSSSSIEVLEAEKEYQLAGQVFQLIPNPNEQGIQVKTVTSTTTNPFILSPLISGHEAPNFSAEDFDGKAVKLSDYRGKFVFIDIWATWCGPCVGEIPNVQAAAIKYKDAPLAIIGVSIDDDMDRAVTFVESKNLTYSQLWCEGGWQSDICKQYQVDGIPATFLIDPEGKLLLTNLRGSQLETALQYVATAETDASKKFFLDAVSREQLMKKLSAYYQDGDYEKSKAIVDDILARGGLNPKDERNFRRIRKNIEIELEETR